MTQMTKQDQKEQYNRAHFLRNLPWNSTLPSGIVHNYKNPYSLVTSFLDSPYTKVYTSILMYTFPLVALAHLIFFAYPITIFNAIWGGPSQLSIVCLLISVVASIVGIGIPMSCVLHRYFAHRAFDTNRITQFALAWIACLAYQHGPLWWACKHRRHHRHCDNELDPHSWSRMGYYRAWIGWTLDVSEALPDIEYMGSLAKYPELRLVERFAFLPPLLLTFAGRCAGIHPAYTLNSMLACRCITLHFNCVYHPPEGEELSEFADSNERCRAVDVMRDIADWVGEGAHDDHHKHPTRARRPGCDYPYQTFLRFMFWSGIAWTSV